MKKLFILFSLLIVGLASCKKGDLAAEQAAVDDAKIQAYIKANNDLAAKEPTKYTTITATKDPSGVYYQIIKQGSDTKPLLTSTVQVSYTGKLLNGTQFSQSLSTFKLSNTIKGWQVVIPKVQAGLPNNTSSYGKVLILVPSASAYGASSTDAIPPNSVLVFNIDVIGYY